ncbi:uncharacterized protein LOC142573891, partial [Dermacentor variabilis]|uniref:uncharacterized protein LOC142573891 n=1 Tax=Dermacentor variabilis TaxID=34621 RepID=UPI003F5B2EA6
IPNSVPPKDNSAHCSRPEQLSVLLVNCRSVKNKVDNFMSLVATVKPQIVMGTESWLDNTIPNVEIFPPGFTVYRKDRHGHGGGVFILISNALSSTQILFENNSESVWCLVKLPNGNNVVYGTFYRPPGSSDSFGLLSEMLSLLPNSVFLGGDFNLPEFNWNAGCAAGNRSCIYKEFEELLGLNRLQQYVLEPTRENAILDLVLCNEPNISKVTVCPGISDHRAVVIELNIQRVRMAQIPQRKVYSYDRGDYAAIRTELENFFPTFQYMSNTRCPLTLWSAFRDKILKLVEIHAPCRYLRQRKKQKPWFNVEIHKPIRKARQTYKTFSADTSLANQKRLQEINKLLKATVKSAKDTFFVKLNKNLRETPKSFWKYVKQNRKEDMSIPSLTVDGKTVTSDYQRAECFN